MWAMVPTAWFLVCKTPMLQTRCHSCGGSTSVIGSIYFWFISGWSWILMMLMMTMFIHWKITGYLNLLHDWLLGICKVHLINAIQIIYVQEQCLVKDSIYQPSFLLIGAIDDHCFFPIVLLDLWQWQFWPRRTQDSFQKSEYFLMIRNLRKR